MAVPVLNGRDFTCAADGFFPSATDCCSGLYYACLDGVAYEQVKTIVYNVFIYF